MKCPKCQFENREGIKFCEECGAKFELECPACKANIPLERKFCGECGYNFIISSDPLSKELSFDEKLDKIQKYLPKGLTEKILSQGERKQVTVMFCDMEGFTQLAEKLDPEDVYTSMDEICEILIHKVHDYEGTIIRALKVNRRHTQANAIHFANHVVEKFPFRIHTARTDNGHEFQTKFHWHLHDSGINHTYIKPASPHLN